MATSTGAPNPVLTEGSDLPPPPSTDPDHDPARPHPDEPGADGITFGGLRGGAPEPAETAREST
jgi:hypothetical protein